MKSWTASIAALTVVLYVSAIVLGLRVKSLSTFSAHAATHRILPWQPPARATLPLGPLGDSIRRGAQIFNNTRLYAAAYTASRVSCTNCHSDGGIQPYASPVVDSPGRYPVYSPRAGRVISLQDRIEECFVRSENGQPLPYDSAEMRALVDYIAWLSQPQPDRVAFEGIGFIRLPQLKPDPSRGARVYAGQCAGCHGEHGEGAPPLFPPLWGPDSFNDGAGMGDIAKLAPFVQHNMPQNRMGNLSPQEAFDVAAFIHAQPRPAFQAAYKMY
ncbi:MAG TPA: c-type cytochrome [Terracidiphilus sp.]|jgi:thiosulfate dehydrogenase|nr:c-type cytochrome [Terracidiphilus sp.]